MWDVAVGFVTILLGLASLAVLWVLQLRDTLAVVIVIAGAVLLLLVGLAVVCPVLRGVAARRPRTGAPASQPAGKTSSTR
jgi:hypothetical protein